MFGVLELYLGLLAQVVAGMFRALPRDPLMRCRRRTRSQVRCRCDCQSTFTNGGICSIYVTWLYILETPPVTDSSFIYMYSFDGSPFLKHLIFAFSRSSLVTFLMTFK